MNLRQYEDDQNNHFQLIEAWLVCWLGLPGYLHQAKFMRDAIQFIRPRTLQNAGLEYQIANPAGLDLSSTLDVLGFL